MYEKLRTLVLPKMIPVKARVLVAVSGGPDSMALGHILWRYVQASPEKEISLVFTHVHHGVRKESDDEARLVQGTAAVWGIPCIIHHFGDHAKVKRQSFQEAARDWRYACWREDMQKTACNLLATAHHMGDQAETILHRLLRGGGPAGLAGIYPVKDAVIRPLLTFSKQDILQYCAEEDLAYALDASNNEPVYLRNRIRLVLLPELERNYNPRIQEALSRTAEIMRWDEDYLSLLVETAWQRYCLKNANGAVGLSGGVFAEPPAILSRLLRKAARLVTGEPRGLGFHYIQSIMAAEGKIGWQQDLPGLKVYITAEGIWFMCPFPLAPGLVEGRSRGKQEPDSLDLGLMDREVNVNLGRWSRLANTNLEIGLWTEKDMTSEKQTFASSENRVAVFSNALVRMYGERLVCRTRRQGDKMWFEGVGRKALKKVFQEARISVQERNRLPLLACGTEVFWIPGVRQSEHFSAGQNKENIYCVLRSRKERSL